MTGAPGGAPLDRRSVEGRGLAEVWAMLGGPAHLVDRVRVSGHDGALPSAYRVGSLAVVSIVAANLAVAELAAARGDRREGGSVVLDRVHAAAAFRAEALFAAPPFAPGASAPVWDPIAGDYLAADGWVRLHTNYAHHRDSALAVLGGAGSGTPPGRDEMAVRVGRWSASALEEAVVAAGGCAAALRTEAAWAAHPQGRAVAAEALVALAAGSSPAGVPAWAPVAPVRPLAGVRVLDLTRVIAGPVATGFLAAHGADVLRVDPVGFEEVPALVPLTTAGKRCCALDLTSAAGRSAFAEVVAGADVLVVGLRPGALDGLGYAIDRLHDLNPGLAVVALDAYGWSGPWAGRRGFDSLVQMSTGIAAVPEGGDRPIPLPAQALDHATGYLAAAAAARSLVGRLAGGPAVTARLSLARTARFLVDLGGGRREHVGSEDHPLTRETEVPMETVATRWGPARRVRWPGSIEGAPVAPGRPAGPLGAGVACWLTR